MTSNLKLVLENKGAVHEQLSLNIIDVARAGERWVVPNCTLLI